ncbi:MAG TPA: ABC transporter permease [Gemmatimonadales bacterium]|jgi:peptide/nickel transport system permease protein|nr:ABC transporter permease [Gemmatimonadales bacterium]
MRGENRLGWDGRAMMGAALLAGAVGVALFAPVVAPLDPVLQRDVVATRFLPPGTTDAFGAFHLLGTDRLGRDVWSRLAYGARVSLGVGALAVLLSVIIGVIVGTVSALARGPIGTALVAATDFALAVPRVVLLLLLAALWSPSITLVVLVLGFTGWMTVARLVYAEARALMGRPFLEAALALGASRRRLLTRHLVPNVATPVIVAAALGVGNAILLEAGLSFLGMGVQPPAPSWGNMIAAGRDALVNAPWVAIAPGAALVLVVVACTLLGDALQDRIARR